MVAIKDTEMPKNCKYCTRTTICGAYLNQYIKDPSSLYSYGISERPDDCPLVEIIPCKDCNNHGLDKEHHPDIDGARYCPTLHTYTGFDYYCGDAERRQ